MQFYLGTHQPHWLQRTETPLFVSRRRLVERKKPTRALGPWALDSGGFTELSLHGQWQTEARQYAAEVRRWHDEVGNLQWAAVQDWMCEPLIRAMTGKSVREHQELTL